MSAKKIMSAEIHTLASSDTVANAIALMCEKQVHNIPVVNKDGSFLGLFSLHKITRALLPKAAQLDQEQLRMGLSFMTDNQDKILRRLKELGETPVSELLEKKSKLRFCRPETPLPEMLQLLYENPVSLPVLVMDGKKDRVVGMISSWDVLTKIAVNLCIPKKAEQLTENRDTPEPSNDKKES